MSSITPVTESDFESVISGSSVPVVLYIYSPECHACQDSTPLIEELATDIGQSYAFLKADVNTDVGVARAYNVHGTPTIILFKDGTEAERMVGKVDKALLRQTIDMILG